MRFKTFISTLSMLLLAAFIGACDDDNSSSPSTGDALVRVIHASYDATAVDVAVDGAVAITSLPYGNSSGYAQLDAGDVNVKVTPTGETTPVVIDANLTLEDGADYTVFAVDQLSNIGAVVLADNRSANDSKAKIRFIHLAPDAPAVDINLNSGDGPGVFENVAFKGSKDYVEVDAGSYVFVVSPAGTDGEVVKYDPITVANGTLYTVAAIGTLDADDSYDFTARVFIDNGDGDMSVDLTEDLGTANVLVAHASPDAPAVDLLVDDMVAGSGLTFPNNTGYLAVTAGTRNLKVNAAGTSTSVINADLSFTKDMNYTIFAVDTLDNIGALVLEDDLSAPASGQAHVRFVHLSPNAPAVDITTSAGGMVFPDNSFKEFTAFTPLAAGSYDLEVRVAGTTTVALALPGIALEDGKIYTIFARGLLGGTGAQALGAQIIVNN
jgi:hypothetical protein